MGTTPSSLRPPTSESAPTHLPSLPMLTHQKRICGGGAAHATPFCSHRFIGFGPSSGQGGRGPLYRRGPTHSALPDVCHSYSMAELFDTMPDDDEVTA
ncbi:hypothetical protein HK405_001009 [Cladochytrium tenue]|nr:hypothetical protein HK405_001009 [Cladochytrium tenue]